MTERSAVAAASTTIRLEPAGDACLRGLDGDRLDLLASRPVAPGTRLHGQLEDGRELRLKVLSCARDGAQFAIEARLLDASRELRRTLAAWVHRES